MVVPPVLPVKTPGDLLSHTMKTKSVKERESLADVIHLRQDLGGQMEVRESGELPAPSSGTSTVLQSYLNFFLKVSSEQIRQNLSVCARLK